MTEKNFEKYKDILAKQYQNINTLEGDFRIHQDRANGMTYPEIAQQNGYSKQNAHKRHKKFLSAIANLNSFQKGEKSD